MLAGSKFQVAIVCILSAFAPLVSPFGPIKPHLAQGEASQLTPLDKLIEVVSPILLGQPGNNAFGTESRFKKYLLEDDSNEEISRASAQEIITRSGYSYENHKVISDDGYITVLIRIVNPMADQAALKQPPVMMLHGGTTDSTLWIWSSAIQHHPERWPRSISEDGPITSWNRSLAFTLANNGYDVWLCDTRGANDQNLGHSNFKAQHSIDYIKQTATLSNLTESNSEIALIKRGENRYWSFTMDNLVEFEIPRQMDKILEVTKANKVNLIGISFSSMTTLSLLSSNLKYAKKVHNYVIFDPIINAVGVNNILSAAYQIIIRTPELLGTIVAPYIVGSQEIRDLFLSITEDKTIRYSFYKAFLGILFGPSAKYNTFLEPAVIGHTLMPTGFMEAKHFVQQILAKRLQKFDYGLVKNQLLYGQPKPPAYDISNIHVKNWMLVSGGRDQLAPPASVKQILNEVNPKPIHLNIPKYNHLDVVAGVETDILINLPVLRFLDRFHLPPLSERAIEQQTPASLSSARQFRGPPNQFAHFRAPPFNRFESPFMMEQMSRRRSGKSFDKFSIKEPEQSARFGWPEFLRFEKWG